MSSFTDTLGLVTVVSWRDQMHRDARRAERSFRAVGSSAERMGDDVERETLQAERSMKRMSGTIGSVVGALGGLGITAGGLRLSRVLGLSDVPRDAADAQHALRALGNVGDLSQAEIGEFGDRLVGISKDVNQTQSELIAGMNTLVAAGLDARMALDFMPVLGKSATASQAAVNDLANTAFRMHDNLEVATMDLQQAMEIVTAAGKEGNFELKDMAQHFAGISASAGALQSEGLRGLKGVGRLSAALQIAMKGAGDPAQAANNFKNFLDKLMSEQTVKNFEEFGIDIAEELQEATLRGVDPLQHLMELIIETTKGDMKTLNRLFRDIQVLSFLKPMMANMEEYRRIRDSVMTSQGVIDRDFANMMTTFNEQLKRLRINLAATIMPGVTGFLEALGDVLGFVNSNTFLLHSTVAGLVGILGVGGAISLVSVLGMAKWSLGQFNTGLATTKMQADAATLSLDGLTASAVRTNAAMGAAAGVRGAGSFMAGRAGAGVAGAVGGGIAGRALGFLGGPWGIAAMLAAPFAIGAITSLIDHLSGGPEPPRAPRPSHTEAPPTRSRDRSEEPADGSYRIENYNDYSTRRISVDARRADAKEVANLVENQERNKDTIARGRRF